MSAWSRGCARPACPTTASHSFRTRDRAAVGAMLAGLDGAIDVIVPRGGKSLVARVQAEARVPVFAHLEGIVPRLCRWRGRSRQGEEIVLNAKMRRTGVCGAAETLLVDSAGGGTACWRLWSRPCSTPAAKCAATRRRRTSTTARQERRREEDWSTEYLDAIIAVKLVDGVDGAIDHVETYGSHHTDCIVTENAGEAEKFLREVDSAIVIHNASTQFADGGEFGFGAEIGIATGRMHARGPVGVAQLTSFKYVVHGDGQTRP